jgi:hypothetical protein
MSPALELVARLRARGVALEPDGSTLVIRPAAAVQPDEVEALRQHKVEVLALLRRPNAPTYAHPWPDALARLGHRRVDAFAPCEGSCGAWSWVRYGAAVLCLPCALAWTEPRDLA